MITIKEIGDQLYQVKVDLDVEYLVYVPGSEVATTQKILQESIDALDRLEILAGELNDNRRTS